MIKIDKQLAIAAISAITLILFIGCGNEALYKDKNYTIKKDGVKQGKYRALVKSDTHIVSDYMSNVSSNLSSLVEFKFSINGKDNELSFGVNHTANLYSKNNETVVVDIVFGKNTKRQYKKEEIKTIQPNTKVIFKLDMSEIMAAFKKDGFYTDIHGEKIFETDFRGVYLAGGIFPMSWDFENLVSMPQSQLKDNDGDGIFEVEQIFNVYNEDAHTSSEWKLKNDISAYPTFSCDVPLLTAIYNMTLDEMVMNMEKDGTFRTGEKWAGVWTRDVSYSIVLGLGMTEPTYSKTSMMRKVKNQRIIQDTGTGGAWPISSDRVVWALSAWELYKHTGDIDWLKNSFEIIKNSVADDEQTIFDKQTGLVRGESSFLDWRKQTYPLWMQPADIQISLNLGTNAAYCEVLNILSMMAKELNLESKHYTKLSEQVKEGINNHLWSKENKYYGQYLYGRRHKTLSTRAEALGEAFCILYDVADETKKELLFENVPVLSYGIPCIYPQIPNISPYHNNGIWPFVQAFWTLAGAKEKQSHIVDHGLASMLRQAGLFLTNKENMVGDDGDFAGTVLNSDRQLWSVAGMLSMVYKVIFGINHDTDRLHFNPVIPQNYGKNFKLSNFKYRNSTLEISIKGFGNEIESFKIDGKVSSKHEFPASLSGNHTIDIVMNNKATTKRAKIVTNYTTVESPQLTVKAGQLSWNKIKNCTKYGIFKDGLLIESISTTTYKLSNNSHSEYQVVAIDANNISSFMSNPVEYGSTKFHKTLQCESFNYKRKNSTKGYNGKGYVEVNLSNNAPLQMSVTAPQAGEYNIQFRYSNGSGPINTDNKCGIRSLYVNNKYTHSVVFPQRGKDEWSNWGETSHATINLKKGKNRIELRYNNHNANMNREVNRCLIDEITISK